jgi:hypothetical protein
MSDRVSIETARKLAAAGWQHTLEPGDWVYVAGGIRLVRWTINGGVNADGLTYQCADCLHMPSAEQIMAGLAAEDRRPTLVYDMGLWWCGTSGSAEFGRRVHCEWDHKEPAEASALAWLAVHVEGDE